jgi:hypothetical protein
MMKTISKGIAKLEYPVEIIVLFVAVSCIICAAEEWTLGLRKAVASSMYMSLAKAKEPYTSPLSPHKASQSMKNESYISRGATFGPYEWTRSARFSRFMGSSLWNFCQRCEERKRPERKGKERESNMPASSLLHLALLSLACLLDHSRQGLDFGDLHA